MSRMREGKVLYKSQSDIRISPDMASPAIISIVDGKKSNKSPCDGVVLNGPPHVRFLRHVQGPLLLFD